jgi:hypothetical protein
MTPTQLALHQAHKARQMNFAIAAQRHLEQSRPKPATMPLRRYVEPTELISRRRTYETRKRTPDYMSISATILKMVAREFDMPVEDLTGPKRTKQYCIARFVAVGIMTEMTKISLPAMGRRLGGRDHTTIIHAQKQAAKLFSSEAFRNRVDQLKAEIAR